MNCWTHQDVLDGLCTFDQIGLPQKANDLPPPEPIHIEDVPAKRLRKDVMKVYHELGGHKYLHKMATNDPAQFNKLLMKVLPQTVEADIRAELVSRDLENLSTAELKRLLLEQIEARTIDVTPTSPHSLESPESACQTASSPPA